jgi:hypothetical protein
MPSSPIQTRADAEQEQLDWMAEQTTLLRQIAHDTRVTARVLTAWTLIAGVGLLVLLLQRG